MRILTVVGNRPQFIKAAAVSGPLRERHEEILVHTGQHYDDSLSRVFFAELGLPRPERELGIGGGSNTSQTARMLAALEPLLGRALAGRGARLRRHQLDARRRARGGAGGRAGRARRGRHALVRPRDARGAQPRAHRPPGRAAAVLLADGRREPARRVGRRADRGGRRRDGRRRTAPPALGPRRHRDARAPRRAERRVPAADGPPRRQRRRSRSACARWSS